MHKGIISFIFMVIFVTAQAKYECQHRYFGFGSTVCVCNSTFCGSTIEIGSPSLGVFQWYATDKAGKRLELSIGKINTFRSESQSTQLYLNGFNRHQKVYGWGGSFTDSSGINIRLLSPKTQLKLLQSYFGRDGGRYNLARVPIAGTDFSVRGYTYDDTEDDVELKHFSLQREDWDYKIPFMRQALSMNPELKFVAAAWTAPPWMKTKKAFGSYGFLSADHYQTYTNYLMKFLDEYKKYGIKFASVSTGNEPTLIPEYPMNLSSMSWTTRTLSRWIVNNLGPTLARSQHNETEIYSFDDQRGFLPYQLQMLFDDEEVKKYVKSIGLHWYLDDFYSPNRLDKTHELFPDKPIIMTEACVGAWPTDQPKARLGSWQRGEYYILKMIENVNHWVAGWIDWNIVLDKTGGPNWINNLVDAPIIVNPETDEFFIQPLYYSIIHFSRFVPRDSIRLDITNTPRIAATAFETPDCKVVVVLCNKNEDTENVSIRDFLGNRIDVTLSARSFNTIIIRDYYSHIAGLKSCRN